MPGEADDGQVGRVLHEAPPKVAHGHAERDAQQDPIGRAVADHQDAVVGRAAPGVVDGGLEERADPGRHVVAALAAGAGQSRRIRLPQEPGRAVTGGDLLVGQALPGAVVHLQQARVGLRFASRDDQARRLDRPPQRARHHAVEARRRPAAAPARPPAHGPHPRAARPGAGPDAARGASASSLHAASGPRSTRPERTSVAAAGQRDRTPLRGSSRWRPADRRSSRWRTADRRSSRWRTADRPRRRLVLPRLLCADPGWRVVGVVRTVPDGLQRDNGMPDPGRIPVPGRLNDNASGSATRPFAAVGSGRGSLSSSVSLAGRSDSYGSWCALGRRPVGGRASKPEGRHGPDRTHQPAARTRPSHRVREAKGRLVADDHIPVPSRRRRIYEPADALGHPSPLLSEELWYEPDLAVETRDQGLQIEDDRLDLHDQQRPGRRVPGDDVDRPSLAVDAERELDDHLPACSSEDRGAPLDQVCVDLVKQARSLPTSPSWLERQGDFERCRDATGRGQRQPFQLPPFRAGHRRLRYAGSSRDIDLAPPSSPAHRTKQVPDASIIHPRMLAEGPSPPVTARRTAEVAVAAEVASPSRSPSPSSSRGRLVLPRLLCADPGWRVVGVVRTVPGALQRDNGMPDPGAYQSPGD